MSDRVAELGATAVGYDFGDCSLDVTKRELHRAGVLTELEPQTFAVLTYLIRHRGRVVEKSELLDEVWGDRFVSESALTTRIKQARAALGDDGRLQGAIKTIHRVGYRFVADVTERSAGRGEDRSSAARRSPWGRAPSVRLFGRDPDLAAMRARLTETRLLTITGPGGVGKTALCTELLSGDRSELPSRSWFCELATTRDPGAVPTVLLTAMGESQQADASPTESVLRVLEQRDDLLVLDNCEHLLEAVAELIEQILDRGPGVRLLATSRVPLRLRGELVQPLGPLDLRDAMTCFIARAADAGNDIDRDDPALAELCERLDRIPLALELAAARSRMFTPVEMTELMANRFRVLHSGGGKGRHDSLHQTIAWSWDDLAADDQDLLSRLGVFVGSFALEDVTALRGGGADPFDTVDALERLVRCSLVVAAPGHHGRTRFRLLESVRDFALEALIDVTGARAAHARYFAERAEALDRSCQSEAVDEALRELAAIWDNLRAAVGYATEAGETRIVRSIVRAVVGYAEVCTLYEVLEWCEGAALDIDLDQDPKPSLAADALGVRARMRAHRGDHERAGQDAARALALHTSFVTVNASVWCAYYSAEVQALQKYGAAQAGLSRGERGLEAASARLVDATVALMSGTIDSVGTGIMPEEADRGVVGALDVLGEAVRLAVGAPDRAATLLEAVVDASTRHGYRLLVAMAATTLTLVTLPARERVESIQTVHDALVRWLDQGIWASIAHEIVVAAQLLVDSGDLDTAARLLGARDASGFKVGLSELLRVQLADGLSQQLGDRYEVLAAQGAQWRLTVAADHALIALRRALDSATEPGDA